jgi:uncharacterized cupredoxin-like copper-binding protein
VIRRRYLLLAALFCRRAVAAAPQRVTVVMVDNRFIPDRIEFQAGVTYVLRLENRGKNLHEFTAPEFFAASKVASRRLLGNGGKEMVVQPHETRQIELTPMKPGEYRLICADHDWDGMVCTIIVH